MMATSYVGWIAEEDDYVAEAVRLRCRDKEGKDAVGEASFRSLAID